ncbi:hypothetical protein J6590_092755 [Homalodisca vitripennis]|nr:hypothetical protein J6590_092755 [Homalodisca vitripennis]
MEIDLEILVAKGEALHDQSSVQEIDDLNIICVPDGVGHISKRGGRPADDNDDMANERKTTPLPATQFAAMMQQA